MFGFTRQDFSFSIAIFLFVGVQGGFYLLTGGPYLLGFLLIFLALVNLDAHYKFCYLSYILTRLWDKLHPGKLKKFVHWRYWEEFKEHDFIKKPDFVKPKIPNFVKKKIEVSLFETFKNMRERLESDKEIKTPVFEVEKDDTSAG